MTPNDKLKNALLLLDNSNDVNAQYAKEIIHDVLKDISAVYNNEQLKSYPPSIIAGISEGYNMWNEKGDENIILDDECEYIRKDLSQNNYYDKDSMRFEVIDKSGRAYVAYNVKVSESLQDDGKTLKIFIK